MKKVLVILFLILFLSGCSVNNQSESEYLFTSLGFDIENGEYKVTAEAVIKNGKNLNLTGKGKTLKRAFGEISRKSTGGLFFSHCGLLAVGKTVGKTEFKNICEHLLKQKITLSALVIKTKNANKLLSEKAKTEVAVGYELMGLVEHYKEDTKKPITNRFFNVAAKVLENEKVSLPLINSSESGYYLENKNGYIQ